ncbi:unnamed protein product [Rhizoctonia solani]|uniref:RRM domain-containing protein n=1 Tax=Rhizoctonia solani TaxID=456999 RepID=A0A8H3D5S4_9AGAM|nr:unnamed protein product [Rhizoctonia solani]
MNDAWANSTDTTPATAGDGWDATKNNQNDRDPYAEGNDTAPPPERESRRSRSRSPARNGADQRGRDDSGNPGTNLHVSGLHPRVTDRHLEDAFNKYGKVEKAQVVYDPHTRDSRCFAFVMMSSLEEAEAAIAGLNGYVLEGSALRVDKARRGRARTPTPGLYRGPPLKRDYSPREYDYRHRGRYDRYYERDYDRYDRYSDRERRYYDDDRYGRDRYSSRSRWDDRDDRDYDRYGSRYRDDERGSRYRERGGYYESRR